MEHLIEVFLFMILLVTINTVLKDNPFFEKGRVVISVCVSLLCVIGIRQAFASSKQGQGISVILWPYIALALGVFTVFFLKLFCRIPKDPEEKIRKSKQADQFENSNRQR